MILVNWWLLEFYCVEFWVGNVSPIISPACSERVYAKTTLILLFSALTSKVVEKCLIPCSVEHGMDWENPKTKATFQNCVDAYMLCWTFRTTYRKKNLPQAGLSHMLLYFREYWLKKLFLLGNGWKFFTSTRTYHSYDRC